MYLGEVHTQTQSMNAVCTATIQGMEQAIQSIDAFAIDTALQGQTYEELKNAGIDPPPYPNAAHHIAPWNDKRAKQAQKLLEYFKIHHDSAANGVFLPGYGAEGHKYVTTEVLHIGSHGPEYIREVERTLQYIKDIGGTQADAVDALHDIREQLLKGTLKLNTPKNK